MKKTDILKVDSIDSPNWFNCHQKEKMAFEMINYMKHKLVPGFIELAKKYRVFMETRSDDDYKHLLEINQNLKNILNELYQKFKLDEKFFKDMNSEFDKIFVRKKQMNKKWTKIFSACELCSVNILSGLINYLDQSSYVITETGCLEVEECVYFFKASLESSLREHYHVIRKLIWAERMKSNICVSFIDPLLIFIEKVTPIPNLHLQIMRTSCFEIMEDFMERQKNLKKHDSKIQTMLTEQRYSMLLPKARTIAKEFITKFLETVTSTLLQIWVIILEFDEKDVQDLKQIEELLKDIREEVSAAYHHFTLFSSQKLRPYGFIVKAILKDSLDKDKERSKCNQKIRNELQDCFSIFINWFFEFVTKYPRSFQLRLDGLSWASNFYQSMIESLVDFKALYKLSQLFTQKIASSDKKKLLDESDYGPWNLLETLENYFAI